MSWIQELKSLKSGEERVSPGINRNYGSYPRQKIDLKRTIDVISSDQPFIWSGMYDLQWYPLKLCFILFLSCSTYNSLTFQLQKNISKLLKLNTFKPRK